MHCKQFSDVVTFIIDKSIFNSFKAFVVWDSIITYNFSFINHRNFRLEVIFFVLNLISIFTYLLIFLHFSAKLRMEYGFIFSLCSCYIQALTTARALRARALGTEFLRDTKIFHYVSEISIKFFLTHLNLNFCLVSTN